MQSCNQFGLISSAHMFQSQAHKPPAFVALLGSEANKNNLLSVCGFRISVYSLESEISSKTGILQTLNSLVHALNH